jgi:hypothetical protein
MISIGTNKFEKVAIPLAIEDRYFLIEEQNGNDLWTVFTFSDGQPVVEVLRNQPQQNALSTATTNPTGIVTVSDPKTGDFLYKLRPGSKNSSIFGKIKGQETEIRVTDREIRIGTNVFQNNTVIGSAIGIKVGKDGSIGMGAGLPPELRKLLGT